MRWSDRRKAKPSHHPHPSSTHFPPPPTPFRKYWRTPVATSQKFGPLLRRTFAPAAILCYFHAKLNFSELLRTLSRGSQKFGPDVLREPRRKQKNLQNLSEAFLVLLKRKRKKDIKKERKKESNEASKKARQNQKKERLRERTRGNKTNNERAK